MIKAYDINLFDVMAAEVEKYLDSYKDDFYKSDRAILFNKKSVTRCNVFYWMLRPSGTTLLNENLMLIKNTYYNMSAYHWLKYSGSRSLKLLL